MMKRHRKALAIGSGVAGAVLLTTGAWAYWTGGGTGTGTTTVASAPAPLVVSQTTVTLPAGIGDGAVALSGTIHNPNGISVKAGLMDAQITSVTGGGTAADFVIYMDDGSNLPMTVNKVIAPRADVSWSGAWLALKDSPTVNQDNLKGATVTITYTVTTPSGS